MAQKHNYFHRVLVGVDTFLNVLTGGNNDETISARSQRAADRGGLFGKAMVWWLDKIQPDHGHRAEKGDLERAQSVEQLEKQDLDKK